MNLQSTNKQAFKSVFKENGEAVNVNLTQDYMFEAARKPQDQNASSNGISYHNTLLVKHKDDAAPFTH